MNMKDIDNLSISDIEELIGPDTDEHTYGNEQSIAFGLLSGVAAEFFSDLQYAQDPYSLLGSALDELLDGCNELLAQGFDSAHVLECYEYLSTTMRKSVHG